MTLLPEARYDQVMTAFGGRGFLVRTPEELRSALELSLSNWDQPSLLNVLIDPSSDRKQQVINIRGLQMCVCLWSDTLVGAQVIYYGSIMPSTGRMGK